MKAKTLMFRDEQAQQITDLAEASGMSESELLRIALDTVDFPTLARERLRRFERVATAGPSEAARDHLRRHAELGGMPTDTQPLESDNAPHR